MRILIIHQNFPAQYLHLAPALARRGHEVVGLGDNANIRTTRKTPGVRRLGYKTPKMDQDRPRHGYLINFESQVRRGQSVARALIRMQREGYKPDVICAHPGWGESLYVKDVFPDVPLICLFEFYYHGQGLDTGFDPEFPADLDSRSRIRTWNANNLLALEAADAGVCPTRFQKSVQPRNFHDKISVIHEGINTSAARPDPAARLTVKFPDREVSLGPTDELVTFVNRNLEPYRGYHTFCRALPEILSRPSTRVVIVGGTRRGYGQPPGEGTWKDHFFNEVRDQIDTSRVLFLDKMPYPKLIKLLQLSKAHVYLTYPFVLSWSLLDAMSCGCPVVGSSTAPVKEVIRDSENGLLVDFFDPAALAGAVRRLLEDRDFACQLGSKARQTVLDSYDLRDCIPRQVELIENTAQNTPE